ncbi:mitochondrial glycoprotein [Calycina marina]|uniref:Mitochondrial glycoprotein n=1 Tax=Calycina marina TaxID=1763456 RepID=A0A9P7Z8Z7_9HELO|nr:mitochondrial glycoprotein [Calycina marina]
MFTIRSTSRSASRAISRLTASAICTPALRQPSIFHSAFKSSPKFSSAFSTSTSRKSADDADLVAKLESEIEMENEMKESEGVPASVKDFLENGPFEIIDTPGEEDVVLTRKYEDETIRITFSIADLNNLDPEADYQDRAMGDEDDLDAANEDKDPQSEDQQGDQEPSYPARVNVVVEKPGRGALAIETVAQDGMIVIENVYYYKDAAHAHAKTVEKVHERQDLYVGPPFNNLDEDLQVLLERYLEVRGVNTALAVFVPDYIDLKEQKEYLRWLGDVKEFVV